jgi:branched-subunit amino acid aminotransferase/4-amino-4-deoxychorismate lyase
VSAGSRRIWLAGRLGEPDSEFRQLNRAVHYGDGLFASMRIERGRLLDARLHATRLLAGADLLMLAPPAGFEDEPRIVDQLLAIADRLGAGADGEAVLRCQWSAAGQTRGYGRERESVALVELFPVPDSRRPVVRLLADGAVPLPSIPQVKSCSALPHVLAARQAGRLGVDEAIRVHGGCVVEGISSNLFFERGGRLYTPEPGLPLYPGILRQRVLEAAEEAGMEAIEGRWSADDLRECDGAFLTNSVRGLEVVARLEDRDMAATPLIERVSGAVRGLRDSEAIPIHAKRR